MDAIVFASLSRLETLAAALENLKSVQSQVHTIQSLTLIFQQDGLRLLTQSPGKDLHGEAHLKKLHFSMYQVTQETVQLSVDFKQLLDVLKSVQDSAQLVTITYPVADSKMMLLVQDDRSAVQYLVETLMIEEGPVALLDPEQVVARVKFGDFRAVKQAIDLITHGKHDSNVYVTLTDDKRGVCVFTKSNDATNVKARVSIPLSDKVELDIKRDCEKVYTTKVLRHLVNVHQCLYVQMKMYEEGALEVEIALSMDCWTKRVMWPAIDINYQ